METNNYNIDDIQKNIRSALDIISEQSKGNSTKINSFR